MQDNVRQEPKQICYWSIEIPNLGFRTSMRVQGTIRFDEFLRERVCILFGSLMLLIHRCAQVMVKLMKNHERLFQNLTVSHINGLIPSSVTAINAFSVASGYSDLDPWRGSLVSFCEQFYGLFNFHVQYQRHDKCFEQKFRMVWRLILRLHEFFIGKVLYNLIRSEKILWPMTCFVLEAQGS